MGIKVGIDLGTTFSAVARINESSGRPEVIKNSFGKVITPSVLCFEQDGTVLFGEDAKTEQSMGNPNTVAFFKRSMGEEDFVVEFFGKEYSVIDLSSILLKNLVQDAELTTGEKIDAAVITVPAYFGNKEREATIKAGEMAGLKVLAIINEPTAAAFAYGLNEKESEQNVLIYDLGGGTFDVTIAKINKDEISVIGSDGNHELGGKDWDDCIARYLNQFFLDEYGVSLGESQESMTSLMVTAESIKKQLTSKEEATVSIKAGGVNGKVTVTRELFEELSGYLLDETKDLTNNLIESVGLSWNDIDGTILVGGSTRMKMVSGYVKEMSGREPLSGVNVDEAVAIGAAIKANMKEENAAIGSAGPKGMVLLGAKKVSDVTAHALGMIAVSADGEKYENSIIIPKNTKIPADKKRVYNLQTGSGSNEMEVYVLQGELRRPLDNTIINKYVISGIENIGSNTSKIEVSYSYTANGVIDVSAVQTDTGKNLPITIEGIPEDMSWTDRSPKEQEPAPPRIRLEIILAIDMSYSMEGKPINKAKEAMIGFVGQMNQMNTSIGVLSFADNAKLLLPPTNDYNNVTRIIKSLDIGGKLSQEIGVANDAEPFTAAFVALNGNEIISSGGSINMNLMFNNPIMPTNILKKKYIVVLTDGYWNNPVTAVQNAQKCHNNGIDVMALGFGGADEDFLKQIASVDEFASMTDLSGLSGSFSKIAQAIGEGADSGRSIKMI
jgi:molecular chaperone DnaK (HSP70)/uncharacterized protein YegL